MGTIGQFLTWSRDLPHLTQMAMDGSFIFAFTALTVITAHFDAKRQEFRKRLPSLIVMLLVIGFFAVDMKWNSFG